MLFRSSDAAPPVAIATPKPAASKPAPTPSKPATTSSAPNAVGAWAAQVGAFVEQSKADAVAGDLKKHGFKAFVMAHKEGTQTLFRVRVGPVATRDAAHALALKITKQTGQAAREVPHP